MSRKSVPKFLRTKLKLGDPNYDRARWWMEYRLNGRRIHKAIPEARTKAQAERAEVSEREAIYNRRFNQGTDIRFGVYYDEQYLPWLKGRSYFYVSPVSWSKHRRNR